MAKYFLDVKALNCRQSLTFLVDDQELDRLILKALQLRDPELYRLAYQHLQSRGVSLNFERPRHPVEIAVHDAHPEFPELSRKTVREP